MTADHLIVIGRGAPDRRHGGRRVRAPGVRASSCGCARRRPRALRELVERARTCPSTGDERGRARDQRADAPSRSARIAAANQIVLHELTPVQVSLEEAFMELTRDEVEYKAADVALAAEQDAAAV